MRPGDRSLVGKRGEGELVVQAAVPDAIFIRPAVMFGPDDAAHQRLDARLHQPLANLRLSASSRQRSSRSRQHARSLGSDFAAAARAFADPRLSR